MQVLIWKNKEVVQKSLFQPLFCVSVKIFCNIFIKLNLFVAFFGLGKKCPSPLRTRSDLLVLQSSVTCVFLC